MPSLRRLSATHRTHQPTSAQTDLAGYLVKVGITAGAVAGHQPLIVGGRCEQIPRSQVSGPDPLVPRHPFGSQQRCGAGNQHHLADGGCRSAGHSGDHHRPLPAVIARQQRTEPVGGRGVVLIVDAQVLAHRMRAAELGDGGAGLFDGGGQHRGHGDGRSG